MDAKERMTLLLDEIEESDVDGLADWWDMVAVTLPIQALRLLLRVADQGGTWLFDPIRYHLNENGTDLNPLSHIMNLSPVVTADIHFLMHLEQLSLLVVQEAQDGEFEYMLTPKGAFAVAFWLDAMSDLSIRHDSLPTLSQWFINNPSATPS